MALLVVPLAPEEAHMLTLEEWDAIRTRERVFFEHGDHPLAERLGPQQVHIADESSPEAGDSASVFVCDPDSPRLVALARAGAEVTAGVAAPHDSLSAAHAAPVVRRACIALGTLVCTMARLRSEDGCPWDREQTHDSLKIHLLEEAHEVLETIDRHDVGEELCEELGDLLLQVVFHARLAAQEGRFDIADVADRIVAKLVHRHPHVFGDVAVADAREVVRNWEALKATEKKREGAFDDIPKTLPALLAAYKTAKRARARGLDVDGAEAARRVVSALSTRRDEDALGRALLWLAVAAQAEGIDPEGALRRATQELRSSLEDA